MIKKTFKIWFKDGEIIKIAAFSSKEALILAQAKKIEKGRDYRIVRSKELKTLL